ncbi:LOW QUALITY PROTEIN: uncharacterized protein [Ptychodera flava]|uniref:LOW QUALITY PROTEIN: uncharacterized protein n=1 Tax=Ptychodera flava TaxID=63121 RepID=UPI003969CCBA
MASMQQDRVLKGLDQGIVHDRLSVKTLPCGDRKFYQLPESHRSNENIQTAKEEQKDGATLLNYIEDNVIGRDSTFYGPFGKRKVVYCDYTASGRSLKFIEDYICDEVLPLYGNTHTTTTVTSLQSTLYRHESRDIVRNAVNASEHDAVVFVGNGCTAAVHKLINALHLQQPPVVFVGPYEHHSTLLPWRELGAQIVRITEDADGLVDIENLQDQLKQWQGSSRQLIGCFAAASNVTGILTDTNVVTTCLHQYGALAFWDYATAGPYVDIDMNPVVTSGNQSLVYKDAIFISPHKFVGGVQTPGILVAKKNLFRNPVPTEGGGGSVFFVTRDTHRYLQQIEMREEGGTPDIVGSIRAGLVFQLKEAVGADVIMAREHELCRRATDVWNTVQNLIILGKSDAPRLPIFSFLIKHPVTGQFLHHNFVCAVLNDVFGVQARGGCACAGPYAQDLLGIDEELALKIESLLLEDSRLDRVHLRRYHEYSEREILRPGFARINFPYFSSDEIADFVIQSVCVVAEHGWKLLPQYMFNPETGEWKHRHHQVFQDRKWLGHISYHSGAMAYSNPTGLKEKGKMPSSYQECLQLARDIFAKAAKVKVQLPDQRLLFDEEAEKLRWFMLPSEAVQFVSAKGKHLVSGEKRMPFHPPETKADRQRHRKESSTSYVKGDVTGSERKEVAFTNTKVFAQKFEHGFFVSDLRHDELQKYRQQLPNSGETTVRQNFNDFNHINPSQEREARANSPKVCETIKGDRDIEHQCGDPSPCIDTASPFKLAISGLEGLHTGKNSPKVDEAEMHTECDESAVADCYTCAKDQPSQSARDKVEKTLPNLDQTGVDSTEIDKVQGMDSVNRKAEPSRVNTKQQCLCSAENSDTLTKQTSIVCQSRKVKLANGGSITPATETTDRQSTKSRKLILITASLFHPPPKSLFKPAVQALEEYRMIEDGDRVLLCLSGGKDSLCLLHVLRQYQFYAKKKGVNFELGAVTVDPQTTSYDPSPLKEYLRALGVPYFYEEQRILEQAKNLAVCESICSFCSRMKRGRIYQCARRQGYNVLAMGQHLDDLAESFLMSAFHNGFLRTMKANYLVREGDLRVIRPLVYVREKDTRQFAEQARLPVIAENCPACFEAPKERHRTKQLLAAQELLFPDLYHSLLSAMKPLMAISRTGMESQKVNRDASEGTVQKLDEESDIF